MFEWSHKSYFSILFLKFLKNGKFIFDNFDIKGSPLWKKNRKFPKTNLFSKNYTFFFLNLYCTCSKLSFEVYNSHVSKNFKFWPIFTWKISFFAIVFWQPACPKLQFIKCLWTAKDTLISDSSKYDLCLYGGFFYFKLLVKKSFRKYVWEWL